MKTKRAKGLSSHLGCPEIHDSKKGKRRQKREGIALVIIDCLKFQEILKEGPFKQYIMGIVSLGKKSIMVLILYNPPNCNNRKQTYDNNNEGTVRMVHEAVKHISEMVKY